MAGEALICPRDGEQCKLYFVCALRKAGFGDGSVQNPRLDQYVAMIQPGTSPERPDYSVYSYCLKIQRAAYTQVVDNLNIHPHLRNDAAVRIEDLDRIGRCQGEGMEI